jgi:hypothetical protein
MSIDTSPSAGNAEKRFETWAIWIGSLLPLRGKLISVSPLDGGFENERDERESGEQ